MNIFVYEDSEQNVQLGARTDEGLLYSLPYENYHRLIEVSRELDKTPLSIVQEEIKLNKPLSIPFSSLKLRVPIEAPEVWAAGVTYQKSREARNYEATEGKLDASTFYDKVYDAVRPELFMKSTAARTVGPNEEVCIRSDSQWQIPEPELGLVLSSSGEITGFTIGNDMSCRDIEGENPLYLPQAKVWHRSCSIGPSIRLVETVKNPYDMEINCKIYRDEQQVFSGSGMISQLKRKLEELITFLVRDNDLFEGTILLTGTNIVPPNDFSLQEGDRIEIEITDIGILCNTVQKIQVKTVTLG
ncbi:fumarylacetoacetate hydrolase family protein [Geomicrobium sp. JCM 19038]|uniref:fumarylacetoacetate hydrolase family protein n=1 Tax=Geomicrobium sp. JCM 19038 TaxID=1460635 RepID=UPI0005AB763C|nr:fumarylacetoacetate hydrolase family protein [Geomicrobium sp. JCM 19038]